MRKHSVRRLILIKDRSHHNKSPCFRVPQRARLCLQKSPRGKIAAFGRHSPLQPGHGHFSYSSCPELTVLPVPKRFDTAEKGRMNTEVVFKALMEYDQGICF